jgi:hypothetical protein
VVRVAGLRPAFEGQIRRPPRASPVSLGALNLSGFLRGLALSDDRGVATGVGVAARGPIGRAPARRPRCSRSGARRGSASACR